MVGRVGVEPTHQEGTDLQSAATLRLRRLPILNRFRWKQTEKLLLVCLLLRCFASATLRNRSGSPSGIRTTHSAVHHRALNH